MSNVNGTGATDSIEVGLLRRAANHLRTYPYAMWSTGDAIAFEAMLDVSIALHEPEWRAWVHGALKAWRACSQPFRESDDTAAGRAMCMIFELVGDDAILDSAIELAQHLMTRRQVEGACVFREVAPLRQPFGSLILAERDRELLHDPGPCVLMNWLQMPLGFLAYLGSLTAQSEMVDFAAHQALAQLQLLQDDSGLLWHFWLERTRSRHGLGWGRGQVWSLLGLMDLLEFLPVHHQCSAPIADRARRLASAIASHQLPEGGWPAVLVDTTSPIEASTACFAVASFSKGVHLSILDDRYQEHADRAWHHIQVRLRSDGVLQGVSGNIGASTLEGHYAGAPLDAIVPWGQGALIIAAKWRGRLAAGL
jgi:rhamnogalacturonyl hydrolase YesR